MTIKEIYELLDLKYPFSTQDQYDNSGVFNSNSNPISDVIVCLDITSRVIDYAIENNVNLIISHHPIFFNKLELTDLQERFLRRLKDYNITCIFLHTPFDKSKYGMNYFLAKQLELKNVRFFDCSEYIAFGDLPKPICLKAFAKTARRIFNTNILYLEKDKDKIIYKVAICGGSASSMMTDLLQANIDVFITGDIKHHAWVDSIEHKITLVDVSHTVENIFVDVVGTQLALAWDQELKVHKVKEKNTIICD